MAFRLTSNDFEHENSIPTELTCDGKDRSPHLAWEDPPEGTQSFALIMEDPDAPDPKAPQRIWVHWILYNIPASARELPEDVAQLPGGTCEGLNDWNQPGYGGPCPPVGRHRYYHNLYALDTELNSLTTPTKADLEEAMEGHILGVATLLGTYERAA